VPVPTNSCGCPVNADKNKPSGCVQVDDTQLGRQGVRKIKVYVKDLYFFGKETWTDHSGCWKIPYRYFGGIHPYIDWYHSQMEVRAMRGVDITQLGRRLKQNCGTHGGGVYNDFQVYHPTFGDNRSIRRTFWAASTCWNALYEFNGYAADENIATPLVSSRLRIWLLNNEGLTGAAPMLKDIDTNDPPQILNDAQVVIPYLSAIILPGAGYTTWSTASNIPDVILNYGQNGLRSDAFVHLCYHEYAHVSHYRGLPSSDRYSYWWAMVDRVIRNQMNGDNSPYGSPNTAGAGRTAIAEAWANHLQDVFADRRYGLERERSRVRQNTNEKQRARYIYWLLGIEQFNPNSGSLDAWIPEGVFWDLYDDNSHNLPPLEIPDPVTDNVQGISNQTMFEAITQNTPTEIIEVRDAIRANAGSNSPAQIDSLFLEYGY
jgi:hypothetical protein